jgi:hypothetical protein
MSLLLASAAEDIWVFGEYSEVRIKSDFSMTLSVGESDGSTSPLFFSSSPPSPAPNGFTVTSGNDDTWGAYEELQMLTAPPPNGEILFNVRYFTTSDAFFFGRPASADAFPWFYLNSTTNSSTVGAWTFLDEAEMLRGGFFNSLDSCASASASASVSQAASASPACDLTGTWNSPADVVIIMNTNGSLTTEAEWGTGNGQFDGFTANVNFSNVGLQNGAVSANCNAISWSPVGSHWTRKSSAPVVSLSDGLIFIFSRPVINTQPRPSLVLSPLDGFSTQTTACGTGGSVTGAGAGFGLLTTFDKANIPAGARATGLLVARPGLKRSTIAVGALLRQRFATTRRRGLGTRALSYWSDNAAGYSFWSIATDLSKWGIPEDLFKQLYSGYKALGIPIVQWEVDSNFIMGGLGEFAGGWCWHNWREWNSTFYPSGGNLSHLLGDASMALYVSSFCNDTVHRAEGFEFVSINNSQWGPAHIAVSHPDSAYDFYTSIFSTAHKDWHMDQLFTDFLCWRGRALAAQLPSYYGAGEAWLGGMSHAAQDLDMEIQYCMACGHQALSSLQWPAVTNARGSGDGGAGTPGERSFTFSSVMAALVGLGWSKDNLRLSIFSQNDTQLQALLAINSLGPVGLSDQLEGFPQWPKPDAGVVTNVTLAMSLCTANGTLLTPSFPLTPIENHMAFENGLGNLEGNVFATFTVVSDSVWFTALGFCLTGNSSQTPAVFHLGPTHIAPLIDFTTLNPSDFSDFPRGAFLGSGVELPGAYVAWDPQSAGPQLTDFNDTAFFPLTLAFHLPQQVNIAPVFSLCGGGGAGGGSGSGAIVLLGERTKATAVSSFRFSSVVAACATATKTTTLTVEFRGAPGESTAIMYATQVSGEWVNAADKLVTMDTNGVATMIF